MKQSNFNRRKFIKYTTAADTGIGLSSVIPNKDLSSPLCPADEWHVIVPSPLNLHCKRSKKLKKLISNKNTALS